jgi:hypothetical protein
MTLEVFTPARAQTTKMAVSSTSARQALVAAYGQLRLWNPGPNTIYVEPGDSTVTANVNSSMPIPSGGMEIITVSGWTHIAAIADSGMTGSLYLTPGDGV